MMSWIISNTLFEKLREILPEGKTILELGSGDGTSLLAKHYNMISIEHDEKYLNLHPSKYIYAPLVEIEKQFKHFDEDTHWYSREVLRAELPKIDYDCILVDGPQNQYGRGGFYKWFDLFKHDIPIFIDDAHRKRESKMVVLISAKVQRPVTIYDAWTDKHWAYIPGN